MLTVFARPSMMLPRAPWARDVVLSDRKLSAVASENAAAPGGRSRTRTCDLSRVKAAL